MSHYLTGAELFAISQGHECKGVQECHWCGSPCENRWRHDDPLPIPFVRTVSVALRPGSLWICQGCWLWRRQRVTVQRLDGSWQDGQSASKHSWWVTEGAAWVLTKSNKDGTREPIKEALSPLWEQILSPPSKFFLSLLDGVGVNHVSLVVVNHIPELKATTPLSFTINNVKHTYTIYELEEASRNQETNGLEPGVQALIRLLGMPPVSFTPHPEKRTSGRPRITAEDNSNQRVKRQIRASGVG